MLAELTGVAFEYVDDGGPPALSDITLSVSRGEFVCLIGQTGSGKTTLAQVLAGLLAPTAGQISLTGKAGMVFQEPERQVFERTVAEDVAFGPKTQGLDGEDLARRVETALRSVALDPRVFSGRSPFSLSGGERRRVALAGVLALDPDLLVLDEPTAGLDPDGKRRVVETIREMDTARSALVMVTHDMDLAAELATRIVIVEAGRIALDGRPRSVWREAEFLANLGLDRPEAVKIAGELAARGFHIEGDPITMDELEVAISGSRAGAAR